MLKDADMWKQYKSQAASTVSLSIGIVRLLFSVLDNPESLLEMVLSPFGNRIVATLMNGVMTVTAAL